MTSFTIGVGNDGTTFKFIKTDGSTSEHEKDANVFRGNINKNDVAKVLLPLPVQTQYVRLYPQSFVNHISLRWDLLECYEGQFIPFTSYETSFCCQNLDVNKPNLLLKNNVIDIFF